MRASGNGHPQVCVQNLLQLYRGENPFERVKGLDSRMIERPVETVAPEVMQDAEWLIETYEPRVTVNEIRVGESDGTQGRYTVTADVTEL